VTTAEKYVTAAYLVVFAAVLLYVLIMATKLARLEREVGELTRLVRERLRHEPAPEVEPEREEVRIG
jgi:CcmD family protein